MYWFGQVRLGRVSSELTLDVSLRRVTDEGVPSGDFQLVSTGIGHLPALHVGQQWRDGQVVGTAASDTFNRVVQLDPSHWRIVDAGGQIAGTNEGNRNYLIPPFEYRLPPRTMSSRCLAITVEGVADALIIPCVEVARAWYFRSTDLVLRLTSAPYAEARHQLFNDSYPATGDDGTPQVVLRTGLSHHDASTVAMLLHDPTAQAGVTRIMDSVARDSAMNRDAFIEALPPIVGARRVRARGKRFRSQGEERFLVSYLEEIPFPDVGARLAWDLDNTNQSQGDGAEIVSVAWPKKGFPINTTSQHELRHEREPRTDSAPVHESGRLPSFAGLPQLERLPPRQQSTQSVSNRPFADPPPSNELSTGLGESTPDGPGELRIQDTEDPKSEGVAREVFPAGFDPMLKVVAEIDAREGLRCRVIPGSDRTLGSQDQPRSLFPSYNAKPRGRWQLVDGRARQFLAIEVATHEGVAYAIEIERRADGRKSPESFALGVLAADRGHCLTVSEFEEIAKACIDAQGVWPPTIGEAIQVQRLRHAYANRAAFADAVVATVQGLLRVECEDTPDCKSRIGGKRIQRA